MPVVEPVSAYAGAINNLFVIVLIIAAVVFLFVTGLLIYFAIRYRGRPGDPEPVQTFGDRRVEIAWIVVPLLIVLVLLGLAVTVARAADPPDTKGRTPDLVVIGHQWWWEIRYTQGGVVTANEIHIPVGKPILVRLESADVIHNFWVPQLGRKIDAVPDQPNLFWIAADKAGTFLGACAEFCGLQHAWMRLRVIAQPPSDFDAWLLNQSQPASPANDLERQGLSTFESHTCANCHAVQPTATSPNVGPNLAHLNLRQTLGAGVLDNTPQNLGLWLKDPQAIKPGALMPNLNLSDAEVAALTAYLEGQ